MRENYKKKYLKYKLKYLMLGGNVTLNKENFKVFQKKYIESQKIHLKKLKKYEKELACKILELSEVERTTELKKSKILNQVFLNYNK